MSVSSSSVLSSSSNKRPLGAMMNIKDVISNDLRTGTNRLASSIAAAQGPATTLAQRRVQSAALALSHARRDSEASLDRSDYWQALQSDEERARVRQLSLCEVTGEAPSLLELRTAQRIVAEERRIKQRERETACANARAKNSLLAMIADEKKSRVLRAAALSPSLSAFNTTTSAAAATTPAALTTTSTAGLVAGKRVAGTVDLVQTSDGALFSAGDPSLALARSLATNARPALSFLPDAAAVEKQKLAANRAVAAERCKSLLVVNDKHVLDLQRLRKNTQSIVQTHTPTLGLTERDRERENERLRAQQRAVVEKKQKQARAAAEVDELLRRKSSHASEAQEEWFSSFQGRMDKLAQREFAQQKSAEIACITINAHYCVNCRSFTENYPDLCKHQGHAISTAKAVKRFFHCTQCKKREATLSSASQDQRVKGEAVHRLPTTACLCGRGLWTPCGLSREVVAEGDKSSTVGGEKLISAASEWTSLQDKLTMGARVSRLD